MKSLLIACLLLITPSAIADGGLDQLLADNAAATGEALADKQSVVVELKITEPTFTVTGHYVATRDGRMRIDVYAGHERVFTEAFDGTSGWQLGGDGDTATDMSAEGQAAVRRGIIGNLTLLRDRASLGYRLSHTGEAILDGQTYDLIDVVAPGGFLERHYVSRTSHRVERRREDSALHPDVDGTIEPVETVHQDFRAIDGVTVAFKSVKRNTETGATLQETEILSYAFDAPVDDTVFRKPGGTGQ